MQTLRIGQLIRSLLENQSESRLLQQVTDYSNNLLLLRSVIN